MIHVALGNTRWMALLGIAAMTAACGSPVVGAQCADGYRATVFGCEVIALPAVDVATANTDAHASIPRVDPDANSDMHIGTVTQGGPDGGSSATTDASAMGSVDTGTTPATDATTPATDATTPATDAMTGSMDAVAMADATGTSMPDASAPVDDTSASAPDAANDAGAMLVCDSGTACGAACVDTSSDPASCGGCGIACDASQVCARGTCTAICPAPLVDCAGACVDVETDENNCGACGHVCASGICNAGLCRTARAGHLVLIGHSFEHTRADETRILRNAVFLSSGSTVRVLAYDHYADTTPTTGAVAQADGALDGAGRTWIRTTLTDATQISSELSVDRFDVMLVYAQSRATDAQIADLASGFGDALASFARAGGVVVVLDGETTNAGTYPIATATSLLDVDSAAVVDDAVVDLAPSAAADAVAAGVGTSYRAVPTSVQFSTSGPYGVFFVGSAPIVLHRAVL